MILYEKILGMNLLNQKISFRFYIHSNYDKGNFIHNLSKLVMEQFKELGKIESLLFAHELYEFYLKSELEYYKDYSQKLEELFNKKQEKDDDYFPEWF
jgi:hypothetical protein